MQFYRVCKYDSKITINARPRRSPSPNNAAAFYQYRAAFAAAAFQQHLHHHHNGHNASSSASNSPSAPLPPPPAPPSASSLSASSDQQPQNPLGVGEQINPELTTPAMSAKMDKTPVQSAPPPSLPPPLQRAPHASSTFYHHRHQVRARDGE